jgi:hypothetical protein
VNRDGFLPPTFDQSHLVAALQTLTARLNDTRPEKQAMTQPTDPTLTADSVIALGAAQLRAPIARPEPKRDLPQEPCPPRSLDERRRALDLAPRALAELLELPSAEEWSAVLPLISGLLELRHEQLRRRFGELAATVQRHQEEPKGITSETVKAECKIELRRALGRLFDLRNAREELALSGALLPELLAGTRCPTCLEPQRPECKSGWTLPDRENPMRLVECATRAEKNGRPPLVHNRGVVVAAGAVTQSQYEKQARDK